MKPASLITTALFFAISAMAQENSADLSHLNVGEAMGKVMVEL